MGEVFLDYTGIRGSNLPRALRFFTRGLGLEVFRRGRMNHGGIWVLLHDRVSHQHLELNYYPKGNRYASPFVPGEGLDHIGFRTKDLAKAGRRLHAAGARRVDRIVYRGTPEVDFYEGPDGIWIELIHTE